VFAHLHHTRERLLAPAINSNKYRPDNHRIIAGIEDPLVIRNILGHLEAKGALMGSCQLPSSRAPLEPDPKIML